jgi:hypothetical protein
MQDQDPDPSTLRTEPLPTLRERRKEMRRLLRQESAHFEMLKKKGAAKDVIAIQEDIIDRLLAAIGYLGSPDPRLGLYRTFALDLPPPHTPTDFFRGLPEPKQLRLPKLPLPPEAPEQLGLPLPLPKPPRKTTP